MEKNSQGKISKVWNFYMGIENLFFGMKKIERYEKKLLKGVKKISRVWNVFTRYEKLIFGYEKRLTFTGWLWLCSYPSPARQWTQYRDAQTTCHWRHRTALFHDNLDEIGVDRHAAKTSSSRSDTLTSVLFSNRLFRCSTVSPRVPS